MTQAQSDKLFREECYQGAGTAEQQAARGTRDPAYLNYTLGKLMIRKLRADWTAKHGGRAAWKAFHDQFLSYGGPPIPLVRKASDGADGEGGVLIRKPAPIFGGRLRNTQLSPRRRWTQLRPGLSAERSRDGFPPSRE